jgi:AcrR family transcriptional regulator
VSALRSLIRRSSDQRPPSADFRRWPNVFPPCHDQAVTSAGTRVALQGLLAATTGTSPNDDETNTDIAILKAAAEVISAAGERNLTIDQVAERAGYTRMTVFRRFGSRDQLLRATYARELRVALETVTAAAESVSTAVERAEIIVTKLIAAAEANPICKRLVQVEPAVVLDLWGGRTDLDGQGAGAALIAHLLRDDRLADPLSQKEAEFVGGLLMRLVVSLVLVPDPTLGKSRAVRRAFLGKVVARILTR